MTKRFASVGWLLVTSLSLAACSGKDAAKCAEALSTTRQALTAQDMTAATAWRTYAYKQCADASELANLDREITAKQTEIATKAAEKTKRAARKKQLITLFTDWVGQARQAPERSVANVTCESEDDTRLVQSKERFCSGSRAVTGVEGTNLQLKYWEKTPAEVALFSVRMPEPVTCAELGEHRVIAASTLPSSDGRTVKKTHCELLGAPLAGLEALSIEGANAELRVFSPKMREQDPLIRTLAK